MFQGLLFVVFFGIRESGIRLFWIREARGGNLIIFFREARGGNPIYFCAMRKWRSHLRGGA